MVKNNLKTIDILISRALIDSNISNDEFVSVNDVSKETIKNPESVNPDKTEAWLIKQKKCYISHKE